MRVEDRPKRPAGVGQDTKKRHMLLGRLYSGLMDVADRHRNDHEGRFNPAIKIPHTGTEPETGKIRSFTVLRTYGVDRAHPDTDEMARIEIRVPEYSVIFSEAENYKHFLGTIVVMHRTADRHKHWLTEPQSTEFWHLYRGADSIFRISRDIIHGDYAQVSNGHGEGSRTKDSSHNHPGLDEIEWLIAKLADERLFINPDAPVSESINDSEPPISGTSVSSGKGRSSETSLRKRTTRAIKQLFN